MTLHLAVVASSARSPDNFRLARDVSLRPAETANVADSRRFRPRPTMSALTSITTKPAARNDGRKGPITTEPGTDHGGRNVPSAAIRHALKPRAKKMPG